MASEEQIKQIIDLLKKERSHKTINRLDRAEMGLRLVMVYLNENPKSYALTISRNLNISRERVRVLLMKLEEKEFIKRTPSKDDARIEFVELTYKGKEHIEKEKEQNIATISKIIDEIGYDKMLDFVTTLNHIKELLPKCDGE